MFGIICHREDFLKREQLERGLTKRELTKRELTKREQLERELNAQFIKLEKHGNKRSIKLFIY